MQIKKVQGLLSGVVILSEASHVFCCVLPTLFSIMGILVGLGVAGAMPLWLSGVHEMIHEWELPIIISSGLILLLGWTVHYVSEKWIVMTRAAIIRPADRRKKRCDDPQNSHAFIHCQHRSVSGLP